MSQQTQPVRQVRRIPAVVSATTGQQGRTSDLHDWARRSVEKIRTAATSGQLRFLPYLDKLTEETSEIRDHYRVMLREPTLKAALLTKVLGVASQDVQVHPDDPDDPRHQAAARRLEYALRRIDGGTRKIAWAVLSGAVVDGWSVSETVLRPDPEPYGICQGKILWRHIKAKDVRRLQPLSDPYNNIIGLKANGYNAGKVYHGEDMESFVIFSHLSWYENPTGMSDMRAAYRAYWIKDTTWRLRAIHLDRYASGMIKGQYSTLEQKAALELALEEARSSSWLTVPAGVLVEAMELSSRGTADYEAAIRDCDREMLVGTVGAYLQMLEGSTTNGRGDSSVHQETSELFQWMLSAALGDVISGQMVRPWYALNESPDITPATVTWGAVSDAALEARARVDKALQEIGLQLSKKETYRFYGRQEPAEPADILLPPGQQAMQQAGQPGRPGAADLLGMMGGQAGLEQFGEKRDSAGRRYCTDDSTGKRTKCPQRNEPAKDRPGRRERPTAEDARQAIQRVKEDGPTPSAVRQVAELLHSMKKEDIQGIKKELGLWAGGNKAQLAQKVADQATARISQRQQWAREARKAGVPQRDFFAAHAEIRRTQAEYVREVRSMLTQTRKLYAQQNGGVLLTRGHPAFRGGDPAGIRGFDEIAQVMADRFPGLLGAHGYRGDGETDQAGRMLYDFLAAGSPPMPATDDTMRQALDYVASGGFSRRNSRTLFDAEPIPFGDAGEMPDAEDGADSEPLNYDPVALLLAMLDAQEAGEGELADTLAEMAGEPAPAEDGAGDPEDEVTTQSASRVARYMAQALADRLAEGTAGTEEEDSNQ